MILLIHVEKVKQKKMMLRKMNLPRKSQLIIKTEVSIPKPSALSMTKVDVATARTVASSTAMLCVKLLAKMHFVRILINV